MKTLLPIIAPGTARPPDRMPATPKIFISYRREDALSQAGRMYDFLEKELGKGIAFYDNEEINYGDKWPVRLENALRDAEIVLVLICNKLNWYGHAEEGKRRIDNPEDWVRKEVETALQSDKKHIFPVLFNDAALPGESGLPGEILIKLLDCQLCPVREKFWSRDMEPLLEILEQKLGIKRQKFSDERKKAKEEELRFDTHHKYTADRREQTRVFDKNKTTENERVKFFYLYGGELQAHNGLFRKIVNRLQGKDNDFLNPNYTPGFALRDYSVSLVDDDLSMLGQELPRALMAAMGISEKDMEKASEKNLAFALKKSPELAALTQTDKVCVHLKFTEWVWDVQATPQAALHFIRNFCLQNLPADGPECYFFFSIEYADNNRKIRDEIETALQNAEYMVCLGELQMVSEDDIKMWFKRYEKFWDGSASKRDEARKKTFGENIPPMYMDDVQNKLEEIILKINNKDEKDADRNS